MPLKPCPLSVGELMLFHSTALSFCIGEETSVPLQKVGSFMETEALCLGKLSYTALTVPAFLGPLTKAALTL